jgi:hypothetical protein
MSTWGGCVEERIFSSKNVIRIIRVLHVDYETVQISKNQDKKNMGMESEI